MESFVRVCLVVSCILLVAEARCPPLHSDSVNFFCLINGDDVGNCTEPSLLGTKARFECKPGMYLPIDPPFWFSICQQNDHWDHEPFVCVQECGMRNQAPIPPAIGQRRQSEFPWHVAIYERKAGVFIQMCGGTLITPSIMVSAAHCFYNEQRREKRDPALFKVVAGKFLRSWDADEPRSQQRDVHNISIPFRYRGRPRNFRYDIAVVRLKTPLDLTDDVNLVCVAWYNEGLRDDLKIGRNGTVPGWRYDETIPYLQSVDLPYVPFDVCFDTLTEETRPLYTPDKFCAGYQSGNISVCPGDSGSGIVFPEPNTGRFFLRGLVSVSFKPSSEPDDRCYRNSFNAFTSFAENREWVQGML